MRWNRSLLSVSSFLGLLLVVVFLWLPTSPAAAQLTSVLECDPALRFNNPDCPDDLQCRRLGGNCGPFNALCLDDPNSLTATSKGDPVFCSWVCAGSEGRCEAAERPCNCDQYGGQCAEPCRLGYACLDGICQEGECAFDGDCPGGFTCAGSRPPECVPPECSGDGDCDLGLCVDGSCVECTGPMDCDATGADPETCENGACAEVECVFDSQCEGWQRCWSNNECVDVCPEGAELMQCPNAPWISDCVDGTTVTCSTIADCPVNSSCCNGFCLDRGPQPPDRPDDQPPPQDGPPTPEPGGLFLFILEKGPNFPESTPPEKLIQNKIYQAHVRYHQRLSRRGLVNRSGPNPQLTATAGTLRSRDARAARKLLENDPAVRAGWYRVGTVQEWWVRGER